jgi:hypothetical protein
MTAQKTIRRCIDDAPVVSPQKPAIVNAVAKSKLAALRSASIIRRPSYKPTKWSLPSSPTVEKSGQQTDGDGGSDCNLDDYAFAMKIALALKSELKDRNYRANLVAGWTDASDRTVKNWISGRYALRPTLIVVGSAFRPDAKRHSVDGGSTGSAFSSNRRGPEAKGI